MGNHSDSFDFGRSTQYSQYPPTSANAQYVDAALSNDPAVLKDVAQIETSAQGFLSSGNRGFAEEFQKELQKMAEKGPDYARLVLNRAAADSHIDGRGDIFTADGSITFSPPPYEMTLAGNLRSISATVKDGQASVTAQPDKDNALGSHLDEIIINPLKPCS